MENFKNKKIAFTHLVKALRSNRSSAKLTQSPSRFSLTGLRFARPSAFTLAEVLITLTVLGVIAAITIPSVIRNFQDRATLTKIKEAYSILDNAFSQAVAEKGYINTWVSSSSNTQQKIARDIQTNIKPYLKIRKDCYSSDGAGGCFKTYWPNSSRMKDMQGDNTKGELIIGGYGYNASMILGNGTSVSFYIPFTSINSIWFKNFDDTGIGFIMIDVDGPNNGPAKPGYDIFFFTFGKKGMMLPIKDPNGSTAICANDFGSMYCNSRCDINAVSSSGRSCTNWIFRHNNLDYKYRDVSSEW